MKKFAIFTLAVSLMLTAPPPPRTFSIEIPQPKLIEFTYSTNPGSVTLKWASLQASTVYVYRDFSPGAKPVATLLPTDTSYTDKPEPGPHTYGLLVIGKEGRVSFRTPLLPIYVPSASENPSNTWLKLWIGKKELWANGKTQAISAPPEIIGGTTFVSVRPIIEAAGGSLSWDGATKTATVTLPPHYVKLTIGKPIAIVDGAESQISKTNPGIAPIIKNGTTMLPFRFIVESLGGKVEWTAAEKRMDILFPLQPKEAVRRSMSAMTMLSYGKIGPIVKVGSVEEMPQESNPGSTFVNNAKVLVFQKDAPNILSFLDTLDPMARKLSKTNIPDWIGRQKGKLFKINYESLTNRIQNFSSVVLMDDKNGQIIDVTFLMFGVEFGAEDSSNQPPAPGKLDMNLAKYILGFPVANAFSTATSLNFTKFTVASAGTITAQPPVCQTCARSLGTVELQLKNTCDEDETAIGNAFIPIISQMTDFTVRLGSNDEFMNISLKDGCGFFPSKQCPEITDKLAEMKIDVTDGRPTSANDTPSMSFKPVKGFVRLDDASGELAWTSTDNSQKTKDLFKVTVEKSPKPRKIILKSNPPYNETKKFGQFLCQPLPFSLSPKPGTNLTITVPILNTPAGRQTGSFEMQTNAVSSVTLPFEKPTGWFGLENDTKTIILASTMLRNSSSFECPCSSTRGIERGEFAIDKTNVGNPKVKAKVVINGDVAFNPPESDVKVALFRNNKEITSASVARNKLEVTLIDETPEPGELYLYCVQLFQNNGKIDELCNTESITPNPWLVTAVWDDGKTEAKQTIDSSTNAKKNIVLANESQDNIPINIVLKHSCPDWKVKFSNGQDSITRILQPNERVNDLQLIVTPEKGAAPGESCNVEVNIQVGNQILKLNFTATIEAPTCSFAFEWSNGGAGIGSDIAPAVSKTQSFKLTNNGNQPNKFNFDISILDPERKDTGPQWQMELKGVMPGETITLDSGETREYQIIVKTTPDMPNGRSAIATISVMGCGEQAKLTWTLRCVLPECEFNLEWDKNLFRPSTTYPGDRWTQRFVITNNTAEDMNFRITIKNEGEKISSMMDYYDHIVYSGESKILTVAFFTPDQARIGEAKIHINVTCGKNEKTITQKLNIVKGNDCWYTANWLYTPENTLETDMPIDEAVYTTIRVHNRSKKVELFMVQIERSDESWISGFDEKKGLKQSFYLKPNEETVKLIIWVKAGDATKLGDKCRLKVSVKACQTSVPLIWDVVCTEKTPLDVKVNYKVDKTAWAGDGSLKVNGIVEFIRQGAGSIKGTGYQYEWFNPDMNDLKLGTGNFINTEVSVYKGLPAMSFEHRVPKSIIDKLVSDGSKRIKIQVVYNFLIRDEETIKKTMSVILELPPGKSSLATNPMSHMSMSSAF